ncbi:hypothetical protein AB4559_18305 [Vibrio sp. 10N.222.51.C8]|jgi:hypothetical protein|uniref:Uncharacterized protein n=4 Tax=Vibrio TaxID=662 RepID=A0A7Z1MLN8_9VIBR|nr:MULTISPECIES: hypothetical protein [Vibrio]OQQ01789.1 hypothetical protein BK411_23130 [Vibrio splendidus]MDA0155426.1 hypothetical protein [Vibrio sp. Makdt]MDC5725757.1 hypothetical protein [Vibrio europaeus]MDC5728358.1 hypothetical protein [Vibrio europaeus]MDC5734571.1 hypothetical protein [Vibrio europaeus]
MSRRTEQQSHDDFCNRMQNNRRKNSGVRRRGVSHRHSSPEREEDKLFGGLPYVHWLSNEMDRDKAFEGDDD